MHARCGAAAWVVLAVNTILLPSAGRGDDAAAAAAKAAAERDARALGWLLQQGVKAIAPMPAPPPAADRQQRQQIEQHAKQLERMFQPVLNSELELIRRCCGGLDAAARRQIMAAGREAVTAAARGFTERQFNGQLGRDEFDPRRETRGRLEKALEPLADPAEFAAYRAEVERREARRAEAARLAILARIDRQLDLSADQREKIEADLARSWRPQWTRELGNRGDMRVNDYPPAPDDAADAIVPHLAPDQVAAWEAWCRAAGARLLGQGFNLHLDGQGIQQSDPWWSQ
ncbi:MAG: hypothetical protein ACKO1M_00710 [Planctomycetota bacterium]